jgi:hypothetical protein
MSNRNYSAGDRAALISLCRGTCYWPECPEPVLLVQDGRQVLRLEIAHIRALEPGGPRHDPTFANPNDFANLLLLCKPHHTIIDRLEPQKFTVEILESWKAAREAPGVAAMAGLRNLTEPRLQEIISESFEEIKDQLDDALARFAEIDSEAAELLRLLRDELVDNLSAGSLLDLDAATMLHSAAHDLHGMEDTANALTNAANSLSGLDETAESLSGAVAGLQGLPDLIGALRSIVDDLKRYGGTF